MWFTNSWRCSATNYSLFGINQAVFNAQGYAECLDCGAHILVDMSGHGRHKRAPCHIGASTGVCAEWWCCLEQACNQVSTTWMWNSMGMFYTHKLGYNCGSHALQYHLECIALKQAPTKWICEACEASGCKAPAEVMPYYYFRNCAWLRS
jgi:hypothetical protein